MAEQPSAASPLRALEAGLYEADPAGYGGNTRLRDGPTVLHMLGTGEIAPSPLPGLRALCQAEPALGRCRHVIADTPYQAGAYLGPDEFGVRLELQIAPELERNPRGLVFLGLSRGGLAALELGSRFNQRSGERVGVLAMGAPLCAQDPIPRTVALIGALEPGTDVLLRQVKARLVPAAMAMAVIRWQYLRNAARVLTELDLDSDEMIQTYGSYLRDADLGSLSLRATREFALLSRVSDAELRHGISAVIRRAHNSTNWRSTALWGERDVWVDVNANLERATQARERVGLAEGTMQAHALPGWNHAMGRQLGQDTATVAAHLLRVCEFVAGGPAAEGAWGQATQADPEDNSKVARNSVEGLG